MYRIISFQFLADRPSFVLFLYSINKFFRIFIILNFYFRNANEALGKLCNLITKKWQIMGAFDNSISRSILLTNAIEFKNYSEQ